MKTDINNPRLYGQTLPKGPYACQNYSDGCDEVIEVVGGMGEKLVECRFWDDEDGERGKTIAAYMQLFAAAPEMLDALRIVYAHLCTTSGDTVTSFIVHSAIAKAIQS